MGKRTGNRRPDAINREFGEKPFINDPKLSYLETANIVMLAAMARRRVEKHSEFQRPWLFDDYLPMDEYYPVPFIYPDWPEMQPVVSETFIPENWDTTCWCNIFVSSPLYCDSPVSVFAPAAFNNKGECIDSASFTVLVNGIAVSEDRLTDFTIFGFEVQPPVGGWNGVPFKDTPQDFIEVFIRGRRDPKTKVRLLMCNEDERLFCRERLEECDCAAADTFTFNDASTPDTIAPGGAISIYVAGGCGPYSWSVVGTGYTLDNATTEDGTVVNGLNSASGTCGVNYGPFATVTVTDNCGDSVEFTIRSTGGSWDFGSVCDACPRPAGNECTTSACIMTPNVFDVIVGAEKWNMDCGTIHGGLCGRASGAGSETMDTWKLTATSCLTACPVPEPPCGKPEDCNTRDNATCFSWECICACGRFTYYEWSCP